MNDAWMISHAQTAYFGPSNHALFQKQLLLVHTQSVCPELDIV